jgi:hypothetical protein
LRIEEDFHQPIDPCWRLTEIGKGTVIQQPGVLKMQIAPQAAEVYSDAQISDYRQADFRWRPPLRLTVRARASGAVSELTGTAGFGFWNQPFMPGQRRFRLPQAVWFFFSSPPSNMRLAKDVPGPGWKAATINARSWSFAALVPTALIGVLLMRIPALYNGLWPIGQRAIGVSEQHLNGALLAETHTYTLDWRKDGATFSVDNRVVHEAPVAPRGPLGFIAWIDNQYAIVTPQGHFEFGLIPVEREQSLSLEYVAIETVKPDG